MRSLEIRLSLTLDSPSVFELRERIFNLINTWEVLIALKGTKDLNVNKSVFSSHIILKIIYICQFEQKLNFSVFILKPDIKVKSVEDYQGRWS